MVFSECWDWNNKSKRDKNESGIALLREIMIKINFDKIKKRIANRSCCERLRIYSIRLASFIINAFFIILGSFLIVQAYIN